MVLGTESRTLSMLGTPPPLTQAIPEESLWLVAYGERLAAYRGKDQMALYNGTEP